MRRKIIVQALTQFKAELKKIYGQRLKQVILYESYARGNARADSDLDLAVVLRGKVKPGKEIDRMLNAVVELNLNPQILISVYPVSVRDFRFRKSPKISGGKLSWRQLFWACMKLKLDTT